MKKRYNTPQLELRSYTAADICTGSPISETGIDFSDLFNESEDPTNFS